MLQLKAVARVKQYPETRDTKVSDSLSLNLSAI